MWPTWMISVTESPSCFSVMGAVSFETSHGRVWFTTAPEDVLHLDTTSSKENCESILLLLDCWLGLIADSPLNIGRISQKPRRVFNAFRKEFMLGPLTDFCLRLSSIADAIVSSTTMSGSGSLTGDFEPRMRDTPIFVEYLRWFNTGDPFLLRYILSFLYFGKKTPYVDSEFDSTAFRGWLDVEDRLSGLEFDGALLRNLRKVVSGLIPSFSRGYLAPHFGPGAVAEKGVRGSIAKSNKINFHPRLDRAFGQSSFFTPAELGPTLGNVIPDTAKWEKAIPLSAEVSQLRFVPKDLSKSRSICMEPNSFMYFQQTVRGWLEYPMRHDVLRRFVDIHDQSRNRLLADYGSYTGLIDTIDLSSASDSVSVELVRKIFPRELLYFLLATRTDKVLGPDGKIRVVAKFAPMGSALCFPVQCIVFTAVIVLSAIAHRCGVACSSDSIDGWLDNIPASCDKLFRKKMGYPSSPKSGSYEPASVYGDDICVDSELTQTVAHLLTSLGFSFNREKSFTGGTAFRESCGGYYWNGGDVTPLRFKAKGHRGKLTSDCVTSLIALANRSGDYGYVNLRRVVVQQLLYRELESSQKKRNQFRFNGINSFLFSKSRNLGWAIYSLTPRNTHLKKRCWADAVWRGPRDALGKGPSYIDYQRDEYRCVIQTFDERTKVRDFESSAFDSYLHQRWWVTKIGGICSVDYQFAASRYNTSHTRLRWKWTPIEE